MTRRLEWGVLYRWAADLTVLLHFLFILFVIFGVVLVARVPKLKPLHWAALAYGLSVEVFNWYCPLTLLEQHLRRAGGQQAYERSFLVHYFEALIYWDVPQWVLISGAIAVVLGNVAIYCRGSARQSSPRKGAGQTGSKIGPKVALRPRLPSQRL